MREGAQKGGFIHEKLFVQDQEERLDEAGP
jgi:hypothetical protein